jgi:sporulation protein YlmC with PRC-barrel domain
MTRHAAGASPFLHLSDLIHRPVRSAHGRMLGRVSDLVVVESDGTAPVDAVIVTSGRWHRRISWVDVATCGDGDDVRLRDGLGRLDGPSATPDATRVDDGDAAAAEILLRRDVLDAQIVDVAGRRLARCSDVVLVPLDDGSLVAAGVDVGAGRLLQRLGLGVIGRHLGEEVVPWSDVHLVSRLGHRAQISPRHGHLERLSSEQLAHLLAALPAGHARDVVQSLPADRAARAIARSDDEVSGRILSFLAPEHAQGVLDEMPSEHAKRLRHRMRRARTRRRYRRTRGWRRSGVPPTTGDPGRG